MSAPRITILQGDDDLAIAGYIHALREGMGDPATAEMNLTRIDARQAALDEMYSAAGSLPFLAAERVVVVHNPLGRLQGREAQERFTTFLAALPGTTRLVLVVEDHQNYRKEWETLRESHWLVRWVRANAGLAEVLPMPLPPFGEMPEWIRKKAAELGGKFSPQAARTLAEYSGTDTRLAMQEIEKLLTYVESARTVEEADVALLTAGGRQAGMFDMVDALAGGNAAAALRLLHTLLEEQDAQAAFAMVVRQFRLLLQAREVLDEGGSEGDIVREMHQTPFVARKLSSQARRFSIGRLERIYHRLLEMDEGMKTSLVTPELALEMLVAELRG